MPHSQLYIKKLGYLKALLLLHKDWMKPKIEIDWGLSCGYDARRHYPPTNLEAARKAHQDHIDSLK